MNLPSAAPKRARNSGSGQGIIELAETLPDVPGDPDDPASDTPLSFDPKTCAEEGPSRSLIAFRPSAP